MARATVGNEDQVAAAGVQAPAGATDHASGDAPRAGTEDAPGIDFERRWTKAGIHPYDEIEWEVRSATIGNEKGETVFEQKGVEVPKAWSQIGTNGVVSKEVPGAVGR